MIGSSTLALVAAILFLPFGIAHIVRTRPGLVRSTALVLTVLYLALVAGVTLGPLPVDAGFEPGFTGESVEMNLVPFKTIGRYFTEGVSHDLTTRQVGGNILLLMPLGFLLPIVSVRARSFARLLGVAVAVSVGIEFLQAMVIVTLGNAGRAIDVDDVILNTCGAIAGWLAWRVLMLVSGSVEGDEGEPRRVH